LFILPHVASKATVAAMSRARRRAAAAGPRCSKPKTQEKLRRVEGGCGGCRQKPDFAALNPASVFAALTIIQSFALALQASEQ
jgi:hypothetical protein